MASATATRPANLVKVAAEGAKLVSPLHSKVESLEVYDAETLTEADELLAGIQQALKAWDAKMEPILKPLREAKTAADALKRDIAKPLEQLEASVKEKIRLYCIQEAKENDRLERERQVKLQAVTTQLEETATREVSATTKQMRERLANRREGLEEKAQELEDEKPEIAKTAHSTTRKVPKWKLADTENGLKTVLQAVLAGKIPYNVLTLDFSYINRVHLTQRDSMKAWPGFELYDDVIIAGR